MKTIPLFMRKSGEFTGSPDSLIAAFSDQKIDRSSLTKLIKQKCNTVKGWHLLAIGDTTLEIKSSNRYHDKTVYTFEHSIYGSFKGIVMDFVKKYGLINSGKISQLIKGQITVKGWKLSAIEGVKIDISKPKIYLFSHPNYGIFEGTKHEFRSTFEVTGDGIYTLIKGTQMTHRGWKLVN